MKTLGYLLAAIRPKQWTKNLLVFAALLFAGKLFSGPEAADLLIRSIAAFFLFCLLTGGLYLVNDLVDLERDRLHPTKSRRPLASGKLGKKTALTCAVFFVAVAVALAFLLGAGLGALLLGYVALELAYSFVLKHLVILDVLSIAAAFVLRAAAGAVAIAVPISPWLYIVTVLLALFVGLSKRRQELGLLSDSAAQHRQSLQHYTPQLLEQLTGIVTASTIMAYSLYTFTAENLPRNHVMMLTIPFVLYGVFRYLYLVNVRNLGGSPEEVLLKDWPLLASVVLWVLASGAILYLYR